MPNSHYVQALLFNCVVLPPRMLFANTMESQSRDIPQKLVIISADDTTGVEVAEAAKHDPALM